MGIFLGVCYFKKDFFYFVLFVSFWFGCFLVLVWDLFFLVFMVNVRFERWED